MIPTRKYHSIPVIYRIISCTNGKIYVGSAKDFYIRYGCYKRHVKRKHVPASQVVTYAMRKYGFNAFYFEILERVDDPKNLLKREQWWIDHFRSYDLGIGYNIAKVAGSTLGLKKSKEEVARSKLLCSKPVVQIDRVTKQAIKKFPSAADTDRGIGAPIGSVNQACRIKNKMVHEMWFMYKADYEKYGCWHKEHDSDPKKYGGGTYCRIKPVDQFSLSGEYIKTWDSCSDAERAYSKSKSVSSHISAACKGERKWAYEYLWGYCEDVEKNKIIREERKDKDKKRLAAKYNISI